MQIHDRRALSWSGRATEIDDDSDIFEELAALTEPDAWQNDATCSQTDPEAFFPEKGGSTREAKRICRDCCPVRADCLQFAIDNDERFGIWGGFSERERRKITRGHASHIVGLADADHDVIAAVSTNRCAFCRQEIPDGARTRQGRFCSEMCKRRDYAHNHPLEHGTEAMYMRHIRLSEDPCPECRIASGAARSERKLA